MGNVIILGAKGRFGRAALHAFTQAGWNTRAFARQWSDKLPAGITKVTGNAFDTDALTAACAGCDVIVHALNPVYEKWAHDLPRLTASVIAAARQTGATVLFPGNVYNYGAEAPELLQETTPWQPTTRKGALRMEMENAFRAARVPTIVLRGGDFIEGHKTGNWFDSQIAPKTRTGKTTYPGPLDRVHAWAYLPDMARAAVLLAEARDGFDLFEEFGFEGYALTGSDLVHALESASGKKQTVSGMPWPIVRAMGVFSRRMREVVEMRYLWQVPHRLDGRKLQQTLPGFVPTPLADAMKLALPT